MNPETLPAKVVLALLPVIAAFFVGRLRRPYGHGLERIWALRAKAPTHEGRAFLDGQARELMEHMASSNYRVAVLVLQVAGTLVLLGVTPVGSILSEVMVSTGRQVFGPLTFWSALALGLGWTAFLFLYLALVWFSISIVAPAWWKSFRAAPTRRAKIWRFARFAVPALAVAALVVTNIYRAATAS